MISNKEQKLFYLASPYTHIFKKIRQKRFEAAVSAAGALMLDHGLNIYSPIGSMHPVALIRELPTDYTFWKRHCEFYIDKCDGLIVLLIDGWSKSKGVKAEIKYAKELGQPVYFYEPIKNILSIK